MTKTPQKTIGPGLPPPKIWEEEEEEEKDEEGMVSGTSASTKEGSQDPTFLFQRKINLRAWPAAKE